MTKKEITRIQNFVKKTLRDSGKRGMSLRELSLDNCSEISRLVGCFVLSSKQNVSVLILKGDNVLGTKQSHDILAIQSEKEIYVLDSTIWQFFPRKRNILIAIAPNIREAIAETEKFYGGKWKISEKMTHKMCRIGKKEWLSVIRQNNERGL